ncbi:helix-turn-helix transcriptional regulator [Enterococcus sp. DIV0240a]|uniref:helix-turn-helix transcriptional regulator n=1 Tax=Enterococcus sp. DIV0240a TaxID=2774651 RepID=UPI003D287790
MFQAFIVKNHIRALRAEKYYSQTKLADLAGCSRNTIARLERNNELPNLALAYSIAKALDADIGEVFEYQIEEY